MTNRPIYCAFPPIIKGEVAIGIEKISNISEEIRPLHAQHYQETETLYLDDPFDPDYERYAQQEELGQYVQFTVRIDWKLVAYLQYYVYRDLHTQGVYQAREDAIFVTKEHRGKGIAPMILAYAEHVLPELGCTYVGMSSKGPAGGPDIGPFLEKNGYRPVATFFVKKLEKKDVLQ